MVGDSTVHPLPVTSINKWSSAKSSCILRCAVGEGLAFRDLPVAGSLIGNAVDYLTGIVLGLVFRHFFCTAFLSGSIEGEVSSRAGVLPVRPISELLRRRLGFLFTECFISPNNLDRLAIPGGGDASDLSGHLHAETELLDGTIEE